MKCDGLCFDFAIFDIDFVAAKNDWDPFADTYKVAYLMRKALSMGRYGAS